MLFILNIYLYETSLGNLFIEVFFSGMSFIKVY